MGATSIFAWLKLQLQKLWCGTLDQERPLPLELTPTPAFLLEEILSNPTNSELSNLYYQKLLEMFEAGNTLFFCSQRTHLMAQNALMAIMNLAQSPSPLRKRAHNYLKSCHEYKRDRMERRLHAVDYLIIDHFIKNYHDPFAKTLPPPESRPAATADRPEAALAPNTLSVAFHGTVRKGCFHPDLLSFNLTPAQLYDIVTGEGEHHDRQRQAFETLLCLFEGRKSLSGSVAYTHHNIAMDALYYINKISRSPERTTLAWEALVYLTTCYNNRCDGAGNQLDNYSLMDLGAMLLIHRSNFIFQSPS